MDEEELRALGDIRNMKSQVEMLKIEFLVVRQEELWVNDMIDTELFIQKENEIFLRFFNGARKLSKDAKKNVSTLYVHVMSNKLQFQVDAAVSELVAMKTEAADAELKRYQELMDKMEQRYKSTPMVQEALALIEEYEKNNAATLAEIQDMERETAINTEKVAVIVAEKEKILAAYKPQYDEQVKELNDLLAQIKELESVEKNAEKDVDLSPKRRLSGVQSQPTQKQEDPLFKVEQNEEPLFVKIELVDNEPQFEMFNMSDNSDEPLPMPQALRALTPTVPAQETVTIQQRRDPSPRNVPNPPQGRQSSNDATLPAQQRREPSPRNVPTVQTHRPVNDDTMSSQAPHQLADGSKAPDNPPRSNEANQMQMESFVAFPAPVSNKRKEGPVDSKTPAKKVNHGSHPPQKERALPSRHGGDNWFERSDPSIGNQNPPKVDSLSKPAASKVVSPQHNQPVTSMGNAGSRSSSSKSSGQTSDRSNQNDDSSLDKSMSFTSTFSLGRQSNQVNVSMGNVDDFDFDDENMPDFDVSSFQGDVSEFGDNEMPTDDDAFANPNADMIVEDWPDFA